MSNIKFLIWVLQLGSLVFGMLFFFFAFKTGYYGNIRDREKYARSLDMMSKSAIAFVGFVATYIVISILAAMMGLK